VEHFDLPAPGIVIATLLLGTLLPIVVITFVPAVLFRTYLRRHRAAWTRRGTHVVHVAYRGSVIETIAPRSLPISVAIGSLMSLYVAVPVLVVLPLTALAIAEGGFGAAFVGLSCSLLMAASAIVGCAILRPSRQAVLGACVVGAVEIVIALAAAFCEWTPLAVAIGVHALALLLAAGANQRANVARCA
jgi:hypothetical protein